MVTFIEIRSPPRTMPIPPWRRRTLCPSLVSLSCFFFFFQLLQGRQCLFEVRSTLYWHSIETYLVRTKPPIAFVMVIFLWCQMVCVIFVRKMIHVATKIFGSTKFNHPTAELFISYKSVMDTLEIPLLALLDQQVGDVVFLVSLLPVTVSVGSSFLYIVVRNGKESDFPLSFSQEVAALAVDDANVPVW